MRERGAGRERERDRERRGREREREQEREGWRGRERKRERDISWAFGERLGLIPGESLCSTTGCSKRLIVKTA